MARPMNPLPESDDPLSLFASRLRALRDGAGSPSLQTMRERCGVSPTSLSHAQSGRHFPSWNTVVGYVTACGDTPSKWRQRWLRTKQQMSPADSTPTGPDATAYRKAVQRWAAQGTITPPATVRTADELRLWLGMVKTFRGMSYRAIAERAPGACHASYAAMLRGATPLNASLLLGFLTGCGIHDPRSLNTWFQALAQAAPQTAIDTTRVLQQLATGRLGHFSDVDGERQQLLRTLQRAHAALQDPHQQRMAAHRAQELGTAVTALFVRLMAECRADRQEIRRRMGLGDHAFTRCVQLRTVPSPEFIRKFIELTVGGRTPQGHMLITMLTGACRSLAARTSTPHNSVVPLARASSREAAVPRHMVLPRAS